MKVFCKSCADTLTKYQHQVGSPRNQKSPEMDLKDLQVAGKSIF